jgi:hypothetical protein
MIELWKVSRFTLVAGLWKQDAGSRCKKPKPDHGPVVYEEFDDLSACEHAQAGGWPPYEESESTLH